MGDAARQQLWALFLNVAHEWPERRIQRVLEPYFIPEQWFIYDRFIDFFDDDPYAVTERRLERFLFQIKQINKTKKRSSQKLCIIPFFALIALILYKKGIVKAFHRNTWKLTYNAIVQPCALVTTITTKQTETLERINLCFLNTTLNKIWEQAASVLLSF